MTADAKMDSAVICISHKERDLYCAALQQILNFQAKPEGILLQGGSIAFQPQHQPISFLLRHSKFPLGGKAVDAHCIFLTVHHMLLLIQPADHRKQDR